MKLAILLSGGKDSLYATFLAKQTDEVNCAITIKSENKESYMYHTPNIDLVELQAKAMNLPLLIKTTKGEKEKELDELVEAIKEAKEKYQIEGVITGAVRSQYQASRVQRICSELDLYCFNPLWQQDQVELLNELIENNFEVIIGGVFAYPFEKEWLGKKITPEIISKLIEYQKKYEINPAGEGGEIETIVTDCPLFSKRIEIQKSETNYKNYAGTFEIIKAELKNKPEQIKNKTTRKEIKNTGEDVLIINTINKNMNLYDLEFIRPISDLITKAGKTFFVKHISKIDGTEKIKTNKVIIAGTTYQDNQFLKFENNIKNITKTENEILGICAGMELLLISENENQETKIELEMIKEIGPTIVESLNESELTEDLDGTECYFLHQKGIRTINPNIKNIKATMATKKGIAGIEFSNKKWTGLQFHPEVNHKKIITKFLEK